MLSSAIRYPGTLVRRWLFFIYFLAVIVFWPVNQRASQGPTLLIGQGKAGAIEVGTFIDEVYNLVGRENTRLVDESKEGMFSPALEITLPGSPASPALVLAIREWPCARFSAWTIEVRDSRFRTREGIGIGSTLADIRQHYGVELISGEGSQVAYIRALRLSFVLGGPPSNMAPVRSVLVLSDPAEIRNSRCPELGPLQ